MFAVGFAGAAEIGWKPNPGSGREDDDDWHQLVSGATPMSGLVPQQDQTGR